MDLILSIAHAVGTISVIGSVVTFIWEYEKKYEYAKKYFKRRSYKRRLSSEALASASLRVSEYVARRLKDKLATGEADQVESLRGSRALGDLEGTLHFLEIRCTKCDRYGRERIARLIDRFGRDARLPDIRHQLAGDCPRRNAAVYERCDVYFANLTT